MRFAAFIALLSLSVAACATATERASPQAVALEAAMPEVALSGEPPLRMTLTQWLDALDIPGLSVAVIDDNELAWAQGFGVADATTGVRMTDATVLQAGSIAKPITAMASLRMVEQGALSLDTDINDALTSWSLPASEFTRTTPVTLRHLLAHTSGITPIGFPGYAPDAMIPSPQQILNGEAPANTPAASVLTAPGESMQYSGPAYTIVQVAMTDTAGVAFPDVMRTSVLAPLNMNSSSFQEPPPLLLRPRLASGHGLGGNVIEGRWRIHPEMAAAGLWTTPSDLAKVAIEMTLARRGQSSRILSQDMASRMLSEEMNGAALGWMVSSGDVFWHNGGTEGFRAQMRMLSASGDGIVLMSNSDNGMDVFGAVMNAVAAANDWPNYTPRTVPPSVTIRLIASQRGVDRGLQEYRTLRETQPGLRYSPGDLNAWGYALLEQGSAEDAVRVFTENIGYYAGNQYAYDSLAEGLLALGDRAGAMRNYRRSLEIDPSNEDARAALARLEGDAP